MKSNKSQIVRYTTSSIGLSLVLERVKCEEMQKARLRMNEMLLQPDINGCYHGYISQSPDRRLKPLK